MKHLLTTSMLMLLLAVGITNTQAQNSTGKKALFSQLPSSIPCTVQQLNQLFSIPQGKQAQVDLTNYFSIKGTVTRQFQNSSGLQTIMIELPAYQNISLVLSKRTVANNQVVYIGHLFNRNHTDGFELQPVAGNQYQLVKIDVAKTAEDCTQ